MKKIALVGLAGFVLAGCGVKTEESDEEILRRLILTSGWTRTSPKGGIESSGFVIMEDTITPFGWIREETGRDNPIINIYFVEGAEYDSAYVELSVNIWGNFHIVAYNPDSGGIKDHIKPYKDHCYLAAIFKRIGDEEQDKGWVMTDVTNINFQSADIDPSVKLDSLLLIGGNPDSIMLYSPDTLLNIQNPRWVGLGDTMKAVAFTDDPDPVLAIYGFTQDTAAAALMTQTQPGVWEGQVPVLGSGVWYLGVDAYPWYVLNILDRPYEAQLWITQFEAR
ncbi:MAG: hypothetical protein ABIM88_05675 [candidate division WOR-3 bacterium]